MNLQSEKRTGYQTSDQQGYVEIQSMSAMENHNIRTGGGIQGHFDEFTGNFSPLQSPHNRTFEGMGGDVGNMNSS